MNIVSIEPTPSPNSMKLNMNESLAAGTRVTYTRENSDTAPDYMRQLLAIPGVKSIFHAADFIALDRTPKGDWQVILAEARKVFGEAPSAEDRPPKATAANEAFGEAQVLMQTFRGIPLQVRVRAGAEESRAAMPERFSNAAIRAGTASPNLIKERQLKELGVRYGELKDIAGEVVQELDASYDDARLEILVSLAMRETADSEAPPDAGAPLQEAGAEAAELRDPDWKKRYAALQRVKPSLATLPLLVHALQDEKSSVRRLATVYLGDIKEPEVLPYLYRALEDDTPSVRRTAGDTLSDLGDPAAIPAMVQALKDPNKLVRWRAARFLYEVGDDSAVAALHNAADDAEFEVRMQVKIALERIEGGHAAEGSVWQQMTRRND